MSAPYELPNVPKQDTVVKAAFIPKLDALGFWDYNAIEMVLLAFYMATACGDDEMVKEILAGLDPHRETAKRLLNIPDPSKEQRDIAKRVGFSLVYGGGAPTLMEQLGLSYPHAQKMVRDFLAVRPGIAALQQAILGQVARRGYITTLWGRHLHPHSDHVALNALIQGCAADLMRQALRNTHYGLRGEGLTSHLVSVVHDELILDCLAAELPALQRLMPAWMDEPRITAVVPITVGMEVSHTTWAEKGVYELGSN